MFTGALLIHHGYEKLANIENFADAFVRPLHLPSDPSLLRGSVLGGDWQLVVDHWIADKDGCLAAGTISVAIYHAIVTAGQHLSA